MRFHYANSVKQAAQLLCRATETICKLYSVSKRILGKSYLARSSCACDNGIDPHPPRPTLEFAGNIISGAA